MQDAVLLVAQAATADTPTSFHTWAGGILALAVGALWAWFKLEHSECKADRKALFAKVSELEKELAKLMQELGFLRGKAAAEEADEETHS